MRKKSYLITLLCTFFFVQNLKAQCAGGRYMDEIFPSFTMDSVTYSTPYSLKMDIYQPTGDTLAARPLIIVAHGGSFIGGTREDDVACDSICWRFAKRGYVTASIDYRLANPLSMFSTDSTQAITEVMQSVSDGKAAIRYFVQDAATTNTYRIDTNNIFIGGNSAGSVLYMQVGYLDSIGECDAVVQSIMAANGGFEGNSGNAGYTTKSKAIINLAGGLNEVSFAGPGDKPSVNCQGSDDIIVPYTCGYPNFNTPAAPVNVLVTLCGLGSLEPQYDAVGIYHMSHVFPGDGHVPWDSDPVKYNTVDSLVNIFLYNMVCTNVASVNTVNINTKVSLFPNPASDLLNMNASADVGEIMLYDETGRMVFHADGINKSSYEINISRFPKGLYFVKMYFSDPDNTPQVQRVVIE